MSLLELIGESVNPGPVGEVKIKREPTPPGNKYVFLHFLISVIILSGVEYYYLDSSKETPMNLDFWIFNGVLLIYLIIGYYLNITPNVSNMGWVPFIIDNPFRFSDDINRFGMIIKLLLMPGKYLLGSIITYYQYRRAKERY